MEFGEAGFSKFGEGNYVQTMGDEEGVLEFGDFSGGYFSPVNREMVPENTTPFAIDIEVTRNNRLKRSPGTTPLEIFEERTPNHIVVHGSLDFTAELLLFDFPYLGVKRIGNTVWANKDLADIGWFAWANFGGTFIFTDGEKVYARQVNDGTTLTELTEAPVALAYASWAGRMWALASVIDSNFEPLGIIWSAANSDYTDWTGLGSGFELLIDQISSGDRGVALVPMGLDFMAIFLRKSIWIARRTGLADRPGDLQPRVPTKGAINSQVLQATQEGVIYVSDNGVELFDGNTSTHISYQIDAELLPLDYSEILHYTSSYNPSTNRYYLHTPAGTTWIYELEFKRWIRRSLDAIESVVWPLQAEDAVVEGKNRVVFLGDHVDESLSQRAIEVEDQASELYFGVAQMPIWSLRPTPQQAMNLLLTSKRFNLEYEGVADIELWAPNNYGVYEALIIDELISQSPPDVVEIYAAKTGRLASLQLRITHGDAEFIHLQVLYINRGPRIALGEGGVPGNFPDRISLQVFPQGSVAPWTGGPGGPQRPELVLSAARLGPLTYQFTAPDSPSVGSWLWDFGDGTTSTEQNPTHVYSEHGTFDATLTAYDADASWYSYGNYPIKIVNPEPTESFEAVITEEDRLGTMVITGDQETFFSSQSAWDALPTQGIGGVVGNGVTTFKFATLGPMGLTIGYSGVVFGYFGQLTRLLFMFDTTELDFTPISGRVKLQVPSVADVGEVLPVSAYQGVPPSTILSTVRLVKWNKPDPDAPIDGSSDTSLNFGQPVIMASITAYTLQELVNELVIEFELTAEALALLNQGGYSNFALMLINDYENDTPIGWNDTLLESNNNGIFSGFYGPDVYAPDPSRLFPTLELEGA